MKNITYTVLVHLRHSSSSSDVNHWNLMKNITYTVFVHFRSRFQVVQIQITEVYLLSIIPKPDHYVWGFSISSSSDKNLCSLMSNTITCTRPVHFRFLIKIYRDRCTSFTYIYRLGYYIYTPTSSVRAQCRDNKSQ